MAEASGDEAKISAVKKTMEQEYRLCTSHTADRLKRVEATVNAIKDGLIPADMFGKLEDGLTNLSNNFHALKSEVESWKNRVKGAKLLWTILGYIAAAGGSGYIVKLLLASSNTVASSGAVP